MSKMKWLLVGVLLGLVLFSRTGYASNWESGRVVTENRTAPSFQSIDLTGSPEVYIQQGPRQTLKVRTDDNLLELLETRVEGGVLRINFREGVSNVTECKIYLTMPRLQYISLSGSGSIRSQNRFHATELFARISGSGNLFLDADVRRFEAFISGSGNCALSGKADELHGEISGSGNLNAFDFAVAKADAAISGSGNANLNVSQALEARISGSGSIAYRGNPRVDANTSGSGRIYSVR